MVEIEANLVAGAANRLVAGELELLNQILVGVLGELSALISIEEDVVDVERGSDKRLLVSLGDTLRARGGRKGLDRP